MLETVIIITTLLIIIVIGGIIEIVKVNKENKKEKEWIKSMNESFMEEMLHHRNQIIQMIEYNYANKGGSVFDLPEDKRLRVDVMLKYLGHSQDEALDLVYKLFNKTEDK